ncbi:MAG: hypothetical protein IPM02_27195 [Betaproteobacteria bacterium]|nr:hypothetical protein [Betaproteobacteria bacterium]
MTHLLGLPFAPGTSLAIVAVTVLCVGRAWPAAFEKLFSRPTMALPFWSVSVNVTSGGPPTVTAVIWPCICRAAHWAGVNEPTWMPGDVTVVVPPGVPGVPLIPSLPPPPQATRTDVKSAINPPLTIVRFICEPR